jgi:hypothetical protein
MIKIYFSFLLIFSAVAGLAQSNYKPGYIVTLKGDTVQGVIDYQEWERSPRVIGFKTAINESSAQKFTPKELRSFEITGFDRYIRYTGKVTADHGDFKSLPIGIDTTARTDTVFLKVQMTGSRVSLLEYTDAFKIRYFIKTQNNEPEELIQHQYLSNDGWQVKEQNLYYGQLTIIADSLKVNRKAFDNQLYNTKYTRESLMGIVGLFNDLNRKSIKSAVHQYDYTRLFIGAGINSSTLHYHGLIPLSSGAITNASVYPTVTFGIDGFINPSVGRVVLRIEGGLLMNDFTTKVPGSSGQDLYTSHTKEYTFSFTPQVIYNVYNTKKLKVFLDAGIAAYFSKFPINVFTDLQQHQVLDNFPAMHDIARYSIPIRAGVVLNRRIELYGLYTHDVITDNYTEFYGDATVMQLGFNFLFGKK